jgi:hypothetical protein
MKKLFTGFKLVYVPANNWSGAAAILEIHAPQEGIETLGNLAKLFGSWHGLGNNRISLSTHDYFISPNVTRARNGEIIIRTGDEALVSLCMSIGEHLVVEAFGRAEEKLAEIFAPQILS